MSVPIKGMTTGGAAAFPELGQIRKGAGKSGNGPGRDLDDKWRFTSANLEVIRSVSAALGDGSEPKQGRDAQGRTIWETIVARDIPVVFMFPTVDENFDAWREEWVAGGLKHRCDGEYVVRFLADDGRYYNATDLEEPYPCPGGCKQSGRLKVFIPELQRLGFFTVLTTAKNDIVTIHNNLSAIYSVAQTLTGIKCVLARRPRKISTPPRSAGGPRTRVEKWLITVEVDPQVVVKMLQAQAMRADRMLTVEGAVTERPMLAAPVDETAVVADTELFEEDDEDDAELTARQRKLIDRIRQLHEVERTELSSEVPSNELALDLTLLSEEELIGLGKRIALRIEVLRNEGDQVGYTQLWEEDNAAAGELLAAHGIEVVDAPVDAEVIETEVVV